MTLKKYHYPSLYYQFLRFRNKLQKAKEYGTNLSYLDSIKKTFVKDEMAACIDSLWMTNLGCTITSDIENINMDTR
jgi:membrane-bound lytic murein transglycosylase D